MSDYHLNGWSDELDRQDALKDPRQADRRHLAFRVGLAIRHIADRNSFDKQDLIALLKEVQRELNNTNQIRSRSRCPAELSP